MRISDWSSDVCSSDLNTGIRRVVMENVDPAEALAGDRTKVADTLFLGQIYRTCHSRSTCAQDFLGNGSSAVDLISASTTDAPASAKALAHASPIFPPDPLTTATRRSEDRRVGTKCGSSW